MPLPPFDNTPPHRILLICTQRIGDVLLATPVARSLKHAWPNAVLHFLVFKGTEGVLEGNPDIDRVITVPHRADWREKVAQFRQLWRRYDLAVSTIATDRARLYGWVAARFRIGFITDKEKGKTLLLDRWLPFDDLNTHTVAMGLRLTELLGISSCYEVIPPTITSSPQNNVITNCPSMGKQSYVVLHPSPKFAYKMWHQQGWIELALQLTQQGMHVVLTGGPDAEERAYAGAIAKHVPVINLVGQLSLAESADLIRHAKLFVGPDTAMTHISAATGIPTIALFGPSNPVKWGPWPRNWRTFSSPWSRRGTGRQGNVFLIQGPGNCVPCMEEGCDKHIRSTSQCLQQISAMSVIRTAELMLTT